MKKQENNKCIPFYKTRGHFILHTKCITRVGQSALTQSIISVIGLINIASKINSKLNVRYIS